MVGGALFVVVAAPLCWWPGWARNTSGTAIATLRLLALSAVPFTITSVALSTARAQRRLGRVLAIYGGLCALVAGLGLPLLASGGPSGLAGAWLIAQCVTATAIAWPSRFTPAALLQQWRVGPLGRELGGLRLRKRFPGGGDARVLGLGRPGGEVEVVVHLAGTERSAVALERRRAARSQLPDAPCIPASVAGGRVRGRRFEADAAVPGRIGTAALDDGTDATELAARTIAAMTPVHGHGARGALIGDRELTAWIDRPADIIAAVVGRRRRRALDAVRAELHASLTGRPVTLGAVHGDLWPGNVVLTDDGRVAGILDWENAAAGGLPGVDRMHMRLTTQALANQCEFGAEVTDALRRPSPPSGEPLGPRTLALLAWLAHAAGNLERSTRYRRNPRWRRANVDAVLDVASRQACFAPSAAQPVAVRGVSWAPAAIGLAGAAIWLACLPWIHPERMTDLGLVSVLGPASLLGLATLVLGITLALGRRQWRVGTGLVFGLAAVLHATPPVIYETLRYAWAYKHVGIVDYIGRTDSIDRGIDALPVYHEWPGFFGADALLTSLARLPDALGHAAWAPLVFTLLNLVALRFLLGAVTDDRRVECITLALFVPACWIGQDYFSPQAFAFFLYLTMLGCALRGRTLLTFVLVSAIVVSHPLTGVMTVLALGVLALAGLPLRAAAIFAAGATALWDLGFAAQFVHPELADVIGSIRLPWEAADDSLAATGSLSQGQQVVATAGRAVVLAIAGLAMVGVVRLHRSGGLGRAAPLLAVAPVALFGAGDYGGEMIFRIYLFALPFLAYLAAHAFPRGAHGTALAAAAISALLCGFMLAHFGKDHQYAFTGGELAASRFVYENAPPGTLLIEGTANYPAQFRNYERFVHVPLDREDAASQAEVFARPAAKLSGWLEDQPGYVILTRSQLIEAREIGSLAVEDLVSLSRALLASPRFEVAFRNPDAVVFQAVGAAP